MHHPGTKANSKVFVAGLSQDTTKEELKNAFRRYGRVMNVWIARNPPGYAFVKMESAERARQAILALNGTRMGGLRLIVEAETGSNQKRVHEESVAKTKKASKERPKIMIGEPIIEDWKLKLVEGFFKKWDQGAEASIKTEATGIQDPPTIKEKAPLRSGRAQMPNHEKEEEAGPLKPPRKVPPPDPIPHKFPSPPPEHTPLSLRVLSCKKLIKVIRTSLAPGMPAEEIGFETLEPDN